MENFAKKYALPLEWVDKYYAAAVECAARGGDGIFNEAALDIYTYMRPKLNELRLAALQDKDNLLYCALLRQAILSDDREAIGALGAPQKEMKDEFFDTLPVFALLSTVPNMIQKHRQMGIPESVTRDTCGMFENQMQDFIDLNHRYGISAYTCWMDSFIRCSMIRVGRFNFAFGKHCNPYDIYCHNGELIAIANGVTFHKSGRILGSVGCEDEDGAFVAEIEDAGDNIIGYKVSNGICTGERIKLAKSARVLKKDDAVVDVHIPSGGPLSPEICDADFALGEEIITKCFGEFNAFVCQSWLLDADLESILGKKTNITRFGDRFCRYPFKSNGADVFEYVFMQPQNTPLDELNIKNSFAQTIKDHLASGGHIYGAGGVFLPRRKMKCL